MSTIINNHIKLFFIIIGIIFGTTISVPEHLALKARKFIDEPVVSNIDEEELKMFLPNILTSELASKFRIKVPHLV